MRRAVALALVLLVGCKHHLRYENTGTREEPEGQEIIIDSGNLIVTPAATRDEFVIELNREVRVQQDVATVTEADEYYIAWSPYALTQFFFISWNPILWTFTNLWTEPEARDHSAFGDWLRLWNPFDRTGGRFEEQMQRADIRREVARRDVGVQRLPLNQTQAAVTLSAGGSVEQLLPITDNKGQVRLAWEALPPPFRTERPITVEVEVQDRGRERAQLF